MLKEHYLYSLYIKDQKNFEHEYLEHQHEFRCSVYRGLCEVNGIRWILTWHNDAYSNCPYACIWSWSRCSIHHHYVPSVVNRSAVMDLHRSRSCATLIQSLYDIFVHSLMLSVHIVLGLPRPLLLFILPSISNRCTPMFHCSVFVDIFVHLVHKHQYIPSFCIALPLVWLAMCWYQARDIHCIFKQNHTWYLSRISSIHPNIWMSIYKSGQREKNKRFFLVWMWTCRSVKWECRPGTAISTLITVHALVDICHLKYLRYR